MALSKIPPAGHAQYAGARNLVTNGAMTISQRGNSTGKTSGGYHACDRFNSLINSAGTWSLSQSTTAPTGFSSSFKLDCTAADSSLAAGDYVILEQRIEGQNLQQLSFGTSSAKKLTLSFYVRSNKTGTYVAEIQHSGVAYNNNTYTINSADTWEKKTITVSGNTSAVIDNDNTEGMRVLFWLAAGSTYSGGTLTNDTWHSTEANRAAGQVNLADSTSNEWYITGVQLEVGSTATDFEHRSYADELRRCQRYFFKGVGDPSNDRYYGARYSTSNGFVFIDFPVTMRAIPTMGYTARATSSGFDNSSYNSVDRMAVFMASTAPYITFPTADAEL